MANILWENGADARHNELVNVECIIRQYFSEADGGIFGKRSPNDDTRVIFKGRYFTLEINERWDYFNLLGTTDAEFCEVARYYSTLSADKVKTH